MSERTGQAPRSAAIHERAVRVMPGGNTRTTLYRAPHPIYAARGQGARVVDVDGVGRLDLVNNYTALIHGHAHPVVVEAAIRAVRDGSCFGLPTESEVALAEAITGRQPRLERIRFANSGAEAVMLAIKAARAFTGRPRIAKFEGAFHGIGDFAEVSTDSVPDNWGSPAMPASVAASAGTPRGVLDDVLVLPFNEPEAVIALLDEHADDLAGVLLDPLPNRVGFIPARPELLTAVTGFCRRSGALVISDEVMSFRLAYGGAQEAFGYEADIVSLGKIIGGGFPVGAVAGRADVMAVFDPSRGKPRVPHGGTFNANPVTMSAGAAALALFTGDAVDRLNAMGDRLRGGLTAVLTEAGAPWQVSGRGSLMRLLPVSGPLVGFRSIRPDAATSSAFTGFLRAMFDGGVMFDGGGMASVSTPMTCADLDLVVDRARVALAGAL